MKSNESNKKVFKSNEKKCKGIKIIEKYIKVLKFCTSQYPPILLNLFFLYFITYDSDFVFIRTEKK